jgi:AcrR family transcriptional regulator
MSIDYSKKNDLRVKYTKQILKESLISLLGQKTLNRITVKELCSAAEINRATFYSHYTDLYDLMDQIKKELTDKICRHIETVVILRDEDAHAELAKFLRLLKENTRLYKVLLEENGSDSMMNLTWRMALDCYRSQGKLPDVKSELKFINRASGNSAMIEAWVRRGAPIPENDMADLIHDLSN